MVEDVALYTYTGLVYCILDSNMGDVGEQAIGDTIHKKEKDSDDYQIARINLT